MWMWSMNAKLRKVIRGRRDFWLNIEMGKRQNIGNV